jgi:hypothetical protein
MNIPYLLAAIVAMIGASLHIYTFGVRIWPLLREDCFPPTQQGGPYVTQVLFRKVWNFFTVSWLFTIGALLFFTFGDVLPYANMLVFLMMIYWLAIVLTTFIVTALSLRSGDSYIKMMAKDRQWILLLVMVGFMYWGFSL